MVKVQQTSVHKICTSRGHTLPLYSGQVTQTSVQKICYSPSHTLLMYNGQGTAALCTEMYFPSHTFFSVQFSRYSSPLYLYRPHLSSVQYEVQQPSVQKICTSPSHTPPLYTLALKDKRVEPGSQCIISGAVPRNLSGRGRDLTEEGWGGRI